MFAGCTHSELRLLDALLTETCVATGRVLVREGHPARQMFIIVSGRARVSRGGETLGTAEPGACISGRELQSRIANTITATAETPMVVRVAGAPELQSLVTVAPRFDFVNPPAVRLPAIEVMDNEQLRDRAPHADVCTAHENRIAASSRTSTARSAAPGSGSTVVEEIEAFLRHDRAPNADRVLAAVMFTDIVGSTAQLSTLGDSAWHTLLDAHDSILGHEVTRHGGIVVNFLGDGALARFECANSAVHCALAVRDAMQELRIDVRSGLHVGEVELRGNDITGIAVHVASRICDIASTGRVLASRTLVELVAGSGLVFEDAGTHTLKGVDGEWQLLAAAG